MDLDQVCLVRVEKGAGHHYQRIVVRFVDGHEDLEIVPPQAAQRFIDAYRDHLRGQSRAAGGAIARLLREASVEAICRAFEAHP